MLDARRLAPLLALLPVACGWFGDADPPEKPAVEGRRKLSTCLAWDGQPVDLSIPRPSVDWPRHHPSAARHPDGDWLVSWQVGRSEAYVAVQAFDAGLRATSDETRIVQPQDGRATHPQLVATDEGFVLAWTDDHRGTVHATRLDRSGDRVGSPVVLREADTEPPLRHGRYPDLSVGPDGALAAFWFVDPPEVDAEPGPAWTIATWDGEEATREPVPLEHADEDLPVLRGGPGTVRHAPDGTRWMVWPELRVDAEGGRTTMRGWAWRPDGSRLDLPLAVRRERIERAAIAFPTDDRMVAAWTRYPAVGGSTWGAQVRAFDRDGQPLGPVKTVDGLGRMIDVTAAGGFAFLTWERLDPGTRSMQIALIALTADGKPACRGLPLRLPGHQTRADVHAWVDGEIVRGLVVYSTGDSAKGEVVAARRFTARPPAPDEE